MTTAALYIAGGVNGQRGTALFYGLDANHDGKVNDTDNVIWDWQTGRQTLRAKFDEAPVLSDDGKSFSGKGTGTWAWGGTTLKPNPNAVPLPSVPVTVEVSGKVSRGAMALSLTVKDAEGNVLWQESDVKQAVHTVHPASPVATPVS